MSGHQGACLMGHGKLLDADTAARVRKYVARVGMKQACATLRTTIYTLKEARDGGRLRPVTKARLLEALEREEATLVREAS